MVEEYGFDFRERKIAFVFSRVQIGSEAHSLSFSVDTGIPLPAVEQPGVKVTDHFYLIPSHEIVEPYLHSSTRNRGMGD
jgi:hypothetical protein